MTHDTAPAREPDPRLAAQLAIALCTVDERSLALLRAQALADPAAPPELAPGLVPEVAAQLREARACGAAATEAARAALLGLRLVGWSDPRYPAGLFDLAGPPALLYVRGRGELPGAAAVAIVGARASTARGRAFAAELGREAAARGGTVVSGLAIGIDQAAHEGALEGGGRCCAVLACGLDRIYPPGAERLAARIEAQGTIVSEMPIGTPPYKAHFPRRNRLLAALARATLVVEADLRSGSLITAHRALELGRGVHAVPGSIDAPASRGTNRLIRDGAHPLLEAGDLDLLLPCTRKRRGGAEALLEALRAPAGSEELAAKLDLQVDVLLLRLIELEAQGRVRRLPGGLYVAQER